MWIHGSGTWHLVAALSPCPPIDSQLVSELRTRTTTPSFSLFSLNPGRKLVPSTKRTRPSKTEGRSISSTVPPAPPTIQRRKPQTRTRPAAFWNNTRSHNTQELALSAASSLAASRFTNCCSTKPGCTFQVLTESQPHLAVRQLRTAKKKQLSAKPIYNINNLQSICIKFAADQLDYSPPASKRGVELRTTITLSLFPEAQSTVARNERLRLAALEISAIEHQFSKIPTPNRNDSLQAVPPENSSALQVYVGYSSSRSTPEPELREYLAIKKPVVTDPPHVRKKDNPKHTLRKGEDVLLTFLAGEPFSSHRSPDDEDEDFNMDSVEDREDGDHAAKQEQGSCNGGTNGAEGNGNGGHNNTSSSQTGTTGSPGRPPPSGSSGGDDGNDKRKSPPINGVHEMDIDQEQEGKGNNNSTDEQDQNEQKGHGEMGGPEEGPEISQAKLIDLAQSAVGRIKMGSGHGEAPENLPSSAANKLIALRWGPVPKPTHFAQDSPNRLHGPQKVALSNGTNHSGLDKSMALPRSISGANREPSSSGEKLTLPSLSSMPLSPPSVSIKDLAELAIHQEQVCSGTPSASLSAAQQVVSLGNPRPIPDTHQQTSPASPQGQVGYGCDVIHTRKPVHHMTAQERAGFVHSSPTTQVYYTPSPFQYPSPEELHSTGSSSNIPPPPYQSGPPQVYPQSRELPNLNYPSTPSYPYSRDTQTDTRPLRRGSAANLFTQPSYEEHSSARPQTSDPMVSVAGRDGPNINPQPTPRRNVRSGADGGAGLAGAFRCKYPNCTALPFQTQYLLNSHANVHSADRPHFCSVPGCPRGEKGRGFKRKNEMIRHGLVHQSPGYICPFCPDREHKYPRPDNLQRHVRVHHPDKNKDDTRLREVLSQRPEGGSRGRRRRA